jgi:dTDP-4-amino-4,6-dideoxygalactose transaminase
MDEPKIPFNRPSIEGKELEYIQDALRFGHVSGDGPYTRLCSELLQTILKAPKVILTTSCTHALEVSSLLLGLKPGDEVIVPSFTFVSTANAFAVRGVRPVFVDIRPDTLNMNELEIESKIGPKTKAIVPVHYAGVGCELESILELAIRHKIHVIEDNAHGLFGKYQGRELGTFGTFGALSFHETKNIICGEGGALIVNDPVFSARAEILCEKGTNRLSFLRGSVDKYTWVDLGSSYHPSDILAAFLYAQLEKREQILRKRRLVWEFYHENLEVWAREVLAVRPFVPKHCEQSYHMYYLILPSLEDRNSLILHLKRSGISGVFHYVPLHSSPMGIRLGSKPEDCPVTERVSDRLVRLPFHNNLTSEEQERVIDALVSWGKL